MRRNIETDPGFEDFRKGCSNIPPAEIERDWRVQKVNMVMSERIWNGHHKGNSRRFLVPRPHRP